MAKKSDSIKMTAGEALNAVRVKSDVTYMTLAEKIGARNYQLTQRALGKNYNMRTNTLILLADALGCDIILRNRMNGKEVILIGSGGDDE